MEKTFVPGKIMYSGFNGQVRPVQLVRQHATDPDVYYVRIYYKSGFGNPFEVRGLTYYFNTREEAINFALAELSASLAYLPSIDELRDLEMSAQPSRYDLSNVFE